MDFLIHCFKFTCTFKFIASNYTKEISILNWWAISLRASYPQEEKLEGLDVWSKAGVT